jgi:hypothetical protein
VKAILVLAAVVAAAALMLCPAALADNSLGCAHGSTCQSGNLGGPKSGGHGTLPFTGIDLAGIAGVAGVLVIGGLTLQRASRRRS